MKTIQINGEARETISASITELVTEIGLPPETLLVEHNGTALHRSEWSRTLVEEGDVIELLRVTAGG